MKKKTYLIIFSIILLILIFEGKLSAATQNLNVNIPLAQMKSPKNISLTLQILLLITVLSLAPSIVIMTSSFIRILIVLMFVRQALTIPQTPPQQVLSALALFLTAFIMMPTLNKTYKEALQPYVNNKISFQEATSRTISYFRDFMFKQTNHKEIDLFMSLAKLPRPKNKNEVPLYVLIPAFMVSELTYAFWMGLIILLPFVIIDMVVASVLMSMGMIMLPPVMISLPFKVLLFVLVDGWHLVIASLVKSFNI